MPTNFPTSLDSYTTKSNNVDTISSVDVNNLQDATVAIETLLGAGSTRVSTWTPTFVTTGTGFVSTTYSSQVGYQMRIGGVIFLQCSIALSALDKTGATGNVRIAGLPFSGVTSGGAISVSQAQNWTTAAPSAGRTNGTQIQLFTNTNFSEVPVANITSTSNLVFTMFYFYLSS